MSCNWVALHAERVVVVFVGVRQKTSRMLGMDQMSYCDWSHSLGPMVNWWAYCANQHLYSYP